MNQKILKTIAFTTTKKYFYGGVAYLIILQLLIFGCEPLDLKRVMDTKTSEIEISGTSVVAHGIVLDVGESTIVNHGHCWSSSPGPTIENLNTDLGAKKETGEFTSKLYGVIPNLTHYVRSYLYDGTEYSYGEEVTFVITAEKMKFTSPKVEMGEVGSVFISSSTNGIGSVNFSNHGHCWSQTDPPTINDNRTAFGAIDTDTSYTSQINNLTMGVYYIRGYLEAEETVIYTNTVTYESYISVETDLISLNSDNSATAFGKINSFGVRPIVEHGHCWSTIVSNPDLNAKSNHSSLGSANNLGTFSSDVEDLISGRTYYIRAYAVDDFSNITYGKIKSFVAN